MNKLLNKKIKKHKDNIELKKYNETGYKHKKVFLTKKNHRFAKNMFAINNISIRDYLQSVMKHVLLNEQG
jgi:hypothetical protein